MSYTLTPEKQISMWIANVRKQLENGNTEAALEFLGTLESDWTKYQRGETIGPITIHTGSNSLIESLERALEREGK